MNMIDYFHNLKYESDKQLLTYACQFLVQYFTVERIYITKSFGKRQEYVAGFGIDSILPVQKSPLTGDYYVFIQASPVPEEHIVEFIRSFLIVHLQIIEEGNKS
jgi:hypothetical protein